MAANTTQDRASDRDKRSALQSSLLMPRADLRDAIACLQVATSFQNRQIVVAQCKPDRAAALLLELDGDLRSHCRSDLA